MAHLSIVNLLGEGDICYNRAWERQRDLVAARQANPDATTDTLLLLSHTPTVTYGKTARAEHRLLDEGEYARRGIELVATDRGGDVTYHGPGQLIGYPILHLGEGRRDLHQYVRGLEDVLLGACADLGVSNVARADFHAGLWTSDGTGYLGALGVRVSRWVTHHGFALNVDERVLDGFSTIVPCGVAGKSVVTLSGLLQRAVSVEKAADAVALRFRAWHRSRQKTTTIPRSA